MNFLGIYREPEFSPGRHMSNDTKILRRVGQALERAGVTVTLASLDEARPLWKPMHLQPLYSGAERFGGEVAEDLFARGLCLPSSSSLPAEDQARVVRIVRGLAGR